MSFILKAQNKSTGKEQIPSTVNLKLIDYRNVGIGAACLVLFIAASWVAFSNFERSLAPEKASIRDIEQNNLKDPETSLSGQEVDEKKVNAKQLTKTQTTKNLNAIPIASSRINSLRSINKDNLIEVSITSHIYTEDPTKRAIFINDQVYRIGDKYRSAEIRDITPTGFVFRVNQNQKSEDLHIQLSDKWSVR